MNDRECIARCLNGSPDCFRHLVERYQSPLFSYLVGILGNRDGAEQAAQETFVRAYFSLSKLKKPESFFSWLLGIGKRVAKEQWRHEKRYCSTENLTSARASEPESINDYDLDSAIAKLPEPYREVILLRYYDDMSCAQVSEQLGIPIGTVTKRLSRAYMKLRKLLGQRDR